MKINVDFFLGCLTDRFNDYTEDLEFDFENLDLPPETISHVIEKSLKDCIVWYCLDCEDNCFVSEEYYMIKDRIWYGVVPGGKGMLCIGCLESRIGRELTAKDFTDCPLNDIKKHNGPARLKDRLNRV